MELAYYIYHGLMFDFFFSFELIVFIRLQIWMCADELLQFRRDKIEKFAKQNRKLKNFQTIRAR